MVRWGWRLGSIAVGVSLLVSGCGWLDRAAGNPKQEAHFMEGENLRRTAQYTAAREAYQKALEVNPANYFAHQELGDLYYQHFNDPGTALYHYRRYLEVGQRVNGKTFTDPTADTCIQGSEFKLAERVVSQLARQRTSVELDQLKRENDALRQQVAEAQRQLQIRALEARNGLVTPTPAPTPGSTPPPPSGTPATGSGTTPTPAPAPRSNVPAPAPTPAVTPRPPATPTPSRAATTYTVRPGDTPATIAKANGIKVTALLAANPGLDPRRMKVGQTLQVPPPAR